MAVTQTKSPIPLEWFARFINIDPLLFNGIDISHCAPYDYRPLCNFYWGQWNQGKEMYNREQLAECICSAYERVSNYLGVRPTLQWECEEIELQANWFTQQPPGTYIENMTFKTKWSHVKEFGQRKLAYIQTVTLEYMFSGDDQFSEEAFFTIVVPDDIDVCDIHAYFQGGTYEIEPIELISYDECSREAKFRIDSWNLVRPELYIRRSWKEECPVKCTLDNFVTQIDVYSDSPDLCKPQVEILYPENHSCKKSCRDNVQPACVRIIDHCNGYFKIVPQTFDENGCVTEGQPCACCGCPYKIRIWYRAGCSSDCKGNCKTDCYCKELINAVNLLATVCLDEYPNCECGCISQNIQKWQVQTSLIPKNGDRWNLPASLRNEMATGFGTKVGEIEALLRLNQILASEQFCSRE